MANNRDVRRLKEPGLSLLLRHMKLMASILACLVLMLSTKPMTETGAKASDEACSMKMSCCKMKSRCEAPKSKKQDKGDPCKEGCNPFMPCSSCCYFMGAKPAYEFIRVFKNINTIVADVSILSNYHHDVWQPPEMI